MCIRDRVLPVASKWTAVEDLAKYRHIIRWVDLIQNTLVEVPEGDKLKVNNDVELPREVKEKKKPAAAAGAETGEKKDKKKEAATSAAAPAQEAANASAGKGPISEEEKAARAEAAKAKKAAKAKAKAEQNAKQAAAVVPPNPSMIDFRVGSVSYTHLDVYKRQVNEKVIDQLVKFFWFVDRQQVTEDSNLMCSSIIVKFLVIRNLA